MITIRTTNGRRARGETVADACRDLLGHQRMAVRLGRAQFVEIKDEAEELGFLGVLAGPLVRSSYRAGRLWARSMLAKGREIPEYLAHLADSELGFAQAVG